MRQSLLLALLLGSLSGLNPSLLAQDQAAESKAKDEKPSLPPILEVPKEWRATLDWRSIGPANMGGRITALAIYEADPKVWWAATASGGLLKTVNNGVSFEHQFDQESVVSIGDVAVAASDPKIVWVGTGESNPRNSVSWGNGVYKSVDGGKSWKHMGLKDSFQIGRVRIHPQNPDVVYVGALGRLWGPSEERGLYKTSDGGETWTKILHVDDETGVIEMSMHPADPDTFLVATYQRKRDGFDTNDPARRFGPGSGLHRTTDGGKSFERITKGLPSCELGRIGLDWSRSHPDTVFMVLESEHIGKQPENAAWLGATLEDAEVGARIAKLVKDGPAAKGGLEEGDVVIGAAEARIHKREDLVFQLRQHVAGDTLKLAVSRKRKDHEISVELGRFPAEAMKKRPRPFGTRLGGQRANFTEQQGPQGHEYGGVYRSDDQGQSWVRVNSLNPRPMYFSQIRVDPSDPQRVYVAGINFHQSKDGGKTFTADYARGIHVDHHALWIDPNDGDHAILGCDGGVHVTWDGGKRWDHLNTVAIGQFYHVGVGPRRDYRVYGGLQDNGSWGGPSRVRHGRGPTNADWMRIGGGDGFLCIVDPKDADLVYYESQNGGAGRRHLGTGERGRTRPRAPKGKKYRFNWRTPFLLSHHNTKIYYIGGNHVFRSLDRGEGAKPISPEITRTDRGSATALAESPRDAGLLWVGTDDGALWVRRGEGEDWTCLFGEPDPVVKSKGVKAEEVAAAAATADEAGDLEPATLRESLSPESPGATREAPASATEVTTEVTIEKAAAAADQIASFLPEPVWVSGIEASRFARDRAYVAFDGHRSNYDAPFALATEDAGRTWRSLTDSLPETAGSVRCIREDLVHENLLYLGCEFGAWVSFDRGQTWTSMNTDLPTVAVHELAQHPLSGEMVAATHGRSLWVVDLGPLRQLAREKNTAAVHLLDPSSAIIWRSEPSRGRTVRGFVGRNPLPGARIQYILGKASKNVSLEIRDARGDLVRKLEAKGEAGLNKVSWNLRKPGKGRRRRFGPRVPAGTYRVVLQVGDVRQERELEVRIDPENPAGPWLEESEEESEEEGGEEPRGTTSDA